MFGFGWVRTHLGVVFGCAFGLCWVFGWISRTMDEISKSGQFRGPMPRRKDPRQRRRSTPRRGQDGGLDKSRVRRGMATVHGMEIFVFCFVLLFYYSKDLSI